MKAWSTPVQSGTRDFLAVAGEEAIVTTGRRRRHTVRFRSVCRGATLSVLIPAHVRLRRRRLSCAKSLVCRSRLSPFPSTFESRSSPLKKLRKTEAAQSTTTKKGDGGGGKKGPPGLAPSSPLPFPLKLFWPQEWTQSSSSSSTTTDATASRHMDMAANERREECDDEKKLMGASDIRSGLAKGESIGDLVEREMASWRGEGSADDAEKTDDFAVVERPVIESSDRKAWYMPILEGPLPYFARGERKRSPTAAGAWSPTSSGKRGEQISIVDVAPDQEGVRGGGGGCGIDDGGDRERDRVLGRGGQERSRGEAAPRQRVEKGGLPVKKAAGQKDDMGLWRVITILDWRKERGPKQKIKVGKGGEEKKEKDRERTPRKKEVIQNIEAIRGNSVCGECGGCQYSGDAELGEEGLLSMCDMGHSCVECGSDGSVNSSDNSDRSHAKGVTIGVPHTQISHTRDSLSRYLFHATLPEIRTMSLMSYLCDLAYTIPVINAGQLFRKHRLRMVTSSLDQKATVVESRDLKKSQGSRGGFSPATAYAFVAAAISYFQRSDAKAEDANAETDKDSEGQEEEPTLSSPSPVPASLEDSVNGPPPVVTTDEVGVSVILSAGSASDSPPPSCTSATAVGKPVASLTESMFSSRPCASPAASNNDEGNISIGNLKSVADGADDPVACMSNFEEPSIKSVSIKSSLGVHQELDASVLPLPSIIRKAGMGPGMREVGLRTDGKGVERQDAMSAVGQETEGRTHAAALKGQRPPAVGEERDAGKKSQKFSKDGGRHRQSKMPTPQQQRTMQIQKQEQQETHVEESQKLPTCPCEWFICDDLGSHTRHIVIQGSDSLASWQANLMFDPVPFEDPALGVFAHRGIYEAAQALYKQLVPFITGHVRAHGESAARIRIGGHSLGGSLAALLTLMCIIRGVIPKSVLEPVFMFGSPSVMCGGDNLLHRLGLPLSFILSIVMHRDIVPRAFACDYPDQVAEVLRRMSSSFRDHPCLLHQRLLYAPMGRMLVLQPEERQSPPHPLLPTGSGLYHVNHPSHDDQPGRRREMEVRGAQRAILNSPHPLEILSDPGAYGNEGSISRDHDPRNYTKILKMLVRKEVKRWRRLQREQRRRHWWPLIGAGKGSGLGMPGESIDKVDSADMGRAAVRAGPALSRVGDRRARLQRSTSRVAAGPRFGSVIASQHIHGSVMVMLAASQWLWASSGSVPFSEFF